MIRNTTRKAVVLLSGGLDSSTVLAIAKSERYDLYTMSFDYKQRHLRELDSAKAVSRGLGVKKHLIIRFDLRAIGGSALTSDMEVPKEGSKSGFYSHLPSKKACAYVTPGIPLTYVPARNTIFLSFALAWAETLEAREIFIGANAIDYSGYPDCRPEYIRAFEKMANLATKASVEGKFKFVIRAPLITMKKAEIIKKGSELGLDYSLTWSCYDPQPKQSLKSALKSNLKVQRIKASYIPCGLCDSCRLRQKGFTEAGMKDPLIL